MRIAPPIRRVATAMAFIASSLAAQLGSPTPPPELDVETLPDTVFEPRPGATDARFFGQYCSPSGTTLCEEVDIVIGGITIGRREVCADIDEIRVALDYHETARPSSRGLLKGAGTVLAEGRAIGTCYSGRVTGTGAAVITGFIPGAGSRAAELALSSNALELTVVSDDKTLRLRKDACGHRAPQVTFLSPSDGAVLNRACPIELQGRYADDRDTAIPAGRARFHSHVDGVLTGTVREFPGNYILDTRDLSVGQHAITFLATDSGGLENGRTISVEVVDGLPEHCIGELPQNFPTAGVL